MIRSCVIAIVLALCPALVAGQIYRHVDEQGNVSFSDQPREGAEEIRVEPVPTYQPRVSPQRPRQVAPPAQRERESTYRSVTVVSPGHEQVVRDNQGLVTVEVSSEPALRDRHVYRLLKNGAEVGSGRQTTFQLENVHRGAYELVVEIVRGDDVLLRSDPSTFFMLQASRLSPAR